MDNTKMPGNKIMPLTDSQLGVYLECVEKPESCKYNIFLINSFPKNKINILRIAEAFDKVVDHYSAFSTIIRNVNGSPVIMQWDGELPKIEIRKINEKEYCEYKKDYIKPFSFEEGLLWRAEIIETEENIHLLLEIHHTIMDGGSFMIFRKALADAYEGKELLPETKTHFEQSEEEIRHKESSRIRESYEYFESYIGGVEADCTLIPDNQPESTDEKLELFEMILDIDESTAVKFSKSNGVTENVFFMGALVYALSEYCAQKELMFLSVEGGRRGGGMENSIGMFVRSFPVFVKVDNNQKTENYLAALKKNYYETMSHDDVSFPELAVRHSISTKISYVYQSDLLGGFFIDGIPAKTEICDADDAISDLDIMIFKYNGRYTLSLRYKSALYTGKMITVFADFYNRIVSEMIAAECLKDIDLMSESAMNFLNECNSNETGDNLYETADSILSKTIEKYPGRRAVSFNETVLTYREFDKVTKKLASYISSKNLGKDDYIPILISRNEFMPVTAWGVVRAGAAYQPLDPTYPQERLNFLVSDSKARLLIAERGLRDLLTEYNGDVLYTDEIADLPEAPDFKADIAAEDALVLIYTSGTTGLPKGCILENRNITAFYYHHKSVMEIDEKTKLASYASFGFDAGVMDIFTTLMAGGELCIMPEEIRLDLALMDKFYIENEITHGFMTTQVGRMFLMNTKCPTLKKFEIGGEALVPMTPPGNFDVVNGYGPSESIAYVTSYIVRNNSRIQPIGKPGINIKAYVANSAGKLLPPGACGELCIAGEQVARGYLGRPEKTAEVFVRNPYTDQKGYERMFKTGDIVRMLQDGNYEFVGRRDSQIKIRGFRVELTEVEQVVRDYPGIKDAAVNAYDDGNSGKYIAAFVVSDTKIDTDDMKRFIASVKPPYIVPAVIMQIDKIPLNANSKVDKRKLPKPERHFEDVIKPQNDIQRKIFDIAAQVIGTGDFGILNSFYEAGLTSIGCIKLISVLGDEFGIPIQIKDIKKNDTVQKLEIFINEARNSEGPEPDREISDSYPITKTQEGIYIESITRPDSTLYNIPVLMKVDDALDENRLKNSIAAAVEAHPYIKTELFTDEEGNIRHRRMDAAKFTADDIETITAESLDDIKSKLVKPFTLSENRLFEWKIIRAGGLYLFLNIHHIIADGTGVSILLRDIEKAYSGETLFPEKYSGFDVAYDEQVKRSKENLGEAEKYYSGLLSGLDLDFLPNPDRTSDQPLSSGKLVSEEKAAGYVEVRKFCEANGISINGLLCAAFGFVISVYSGSDYAVFNTVYNGRNDSRLMDTVSMLVKTFPVVCNAESGNPAEIARKVSDRLIESMANDVYSYGEIARTFGVKNDIIFVYQGESFSFDSFCGKSSQYIPMELSDAKAEITFQVSIKNGKFIYEIEYNPERFTEAIIRAISGAFDMAISGFINEKDISRVSLVSPEDIKLMDRINETEREYDAELTITDHFLLQAEKHPDSICVSYKNKAFSFAEIRRLTGNIASCLNRHGIGKGDIVAILINRDENMVTGTHGVLRAGAAYMGLDPTYPPEKLNFMMKDSEAKMLIADRKLRHLVNEYKGDVLYTDEFVNLPEMDSPSAVITPENEAIVIYSSGTTGVPKGSVLTHGNIVCFFNSYIEYMNITHNSHIASYASFGFDGGAMDVFSAPMAGAALYVIPDEIRLDLARLENFYINNKITSGFMTTQVGCMFMGMTGCRTLTHFMVGGEKLIPAESPEWVTFYNGYGPSETFCFVNKYEVTNTGSVQPIGKVNYNTKEYIIDRFGNRLPFGACGELCISGGQTGKGYLNRPEKNIAAFVENPFCDEPAYRRMYKTGDIVRMLPDGNYDFVGRRDGQVKIRGFRVELSEIEHKIRQYRGIESTVVQAFDNPSGGKYLAAYVVSGNPVDTDNLKAFIASEKPAYMVPAVIIQLDEIPLTSNGKVDKRALPKPESIERTAGSEPQNETEEIFCDIFGEILGIDKVYADDDFFEIGGTSISAIKAVVKCEEAGFSVVFKNIFANPTPQKLAQFIHTGKNEDVFAPDEEESKKYDYSALEYNVIENLQNITYNGVGDVLLTGVTGFLGSHIFKELMNHTDGNVICLVRSKKDLPAEVRFRMIMTYYFEDWYSDDFSDRTTIIDSELGDESIQSKLSGLHFDTIINSAANVKHFAAGDELLRDNYSGVENLILLAENTGAKLIQLSSLSVSGESVNGNIPADFVFKENNLNIGQSLENRYVYSKYLAEQAIIDAVSKRKIKGKIIRLGNLMARIDDSEFQINANTNGFLRQFTGYKKLGCYPVDMLDAEIEFSPIDSVAEAVVLLSGTPDEFTVFHAKNCNSIHYGYFMNAMKKQGMSIEIVENDIFEQRFKDALKNDSDIADFSGFIAYMNRADSSTSEALNSEISAQNETDLEMRIKVPSGTQFTTKALYRLGFAWPLISEEYLEKMVEVLKDLDFFYTL